MASKKNRGAQAPTQTETGTPMTTENQNDQPTEGSVDQSTDNATEQTTGNESNDNTGSEQSGNEGTEDTTGTPSEEQAAPAPTPAPAVEAPVVETAAPVNLVAPVVTQEVTEEAEFVNPNDAVAASYGVTSISALLALQTIDGYIAAMGPAIPVNEEEGGRQQVTLYRSMISIINNSGDDFENAFSALLAAFYKHKDTVFNEVSVYRFSENMMLPKADRDTFQRLINMCMLTADPKGRSAGVKQINFEATLGNSINDEGRQRINAYFHL
jgi:hypothetical protein